MERKISLITMGAGNVLVLKETLESFKSIVNEVVYGDMLLFPEDRDILYGYKKEYNINIQRLPFNYIFQMGFSNCLNYLISNAKNDLCLYMNTSEVIDEDYGINDIVDSNPECNTFYFSHRQENHRWFRLSDRRYIRWSGNIHEDSAGDIRPYHKPIFMMADKEKDLDNPLKAKILNDCKELSYFNNYLKLIDKPHEQGATNDGWIKFVADQYEDMKQRLLNKCKRYEAFKIGDLEMYMQDVQNSPEFEKERFESSNMIAFQGDKIHLL